jgi:hypothetical protein
MFSLIAIVVFVTLAAADHPAPAYHPAPLYHAAPQPYAFQYGINDAEHNNHFSANENANGQTITGGYSVRTNAMLSTRFANSLAISYLIIIFDLKCVLIQKIIPRDFTNLFLQILG